VLSANARPMRVLHISICTCCPARTPNSAGCGHWRLDPDLVVNTGDNLAHQQAVPAVIRALGPLWTARVLFVFGATTLRAQNQEPGPLPDQDKKQS